MKRIHFALYSVKLDCLLAPVLSDIDALHPADAGRVRLIRITQEEYDTRAAWTKSLQRKIMKRAKYIPVVQYKLTRDWSINKT